MRTSESIAKIAPALATAQAKMGAAIKGSANPFFHSKYADLGAVVEACKGPLNEQQISILQPVSTDEQSAIWVETILLHASGEFISERMRVAIAPKEKKDKQGNVIATIDCKDDPQAIGSAITYFRRYSLQSLIGIPSEDDDGEGAQGRGQQPARREQRRSVPSAERSERRAPEAPDFSAAGQKTLSGMMNGVEEKSGTGKNGKPYTLYIVKIGDAETKTFDAALADAARAAFDQDVIGEVEEVRQGERVAYKLMSLREAGGSHGNGGEDGLHY